MNVSDPSWEDNAQSQTAEESNIVWIASYPRSGNTLCRHVLWDCLGLKSLSEDEFRSEVRRDPMVPVEPLLERVPVGISWEQYARMTEADGKLHFVKTHAAPPGDNRKALCIIRDGRKAIWSYRCFQRDFFGEKGRSLHEILLGSDPYGSWSSHVKHWQQRPAGRTFFLSYEELTSISLPRLEELRAFLNVDAEIKPWQNHFRERQAAKPKLYREGRVEWEPQADWTPDVDAVFRAIHGPLMEELGYWPPGEAARNQSAELGEILRLASEQAILSWQRMVHANGLEAAREQCQEQLRNLAATNASLAAINAGFASTNSTQATALAKAKRAEAELREKRIADRQKIDNLKAKLALAQRSWIRKLLDKHKH